MQSLANQGFMTVTELVAYRVPKDYVFLPVFATNIRFSVELKATTLKF
jgi:hypothetical protein